MKTKILLLWLIFAAKGMGIIDAQTLDKRFASTNGTVKTIVQNSTTAYIGGNFTYVGTAAKRLARFNPGNIKPDISYPQLAGSDYPQTIEPDGSGGFYAGGYFDNFNGTAITATSIIHVLANNTLDVGFATVPDGLYSIYALKKQGSRLYVGGSFTTLQGSARTNLGALDANTGSLLSWLPDAPNSVPYKIEANDSLVFIEGPFSYVGGYSTPNQFAALKAVTGAYVRNFPTGNSTVTGIKINGNTLYMGGNFTSLGIPTQGAAKITAATGAVDFNFPSTDGQVLAIQPDGSGGYYIGGAFNTVGKQGHSNIAHILSTGAVDPAFTISVNSQVQCLTSDGTNLYIGGYFTQVNGTTTRNYGAAINMSTKALTAWDPNTNNVILTMAVANSTIYFGGYFTTVRGGTSRNYTAALSAANSLSSWAPNPDNAVMQLIPNSNGSSIFLGGSFSTVKGATHPFVAKVNSTNGNVATWNPSPNSQVNCMALNGSVLYMAGTFNTVNGVARQYLAGIDTASNNPTSFTADADNYVNTLNIAGGKLYVGGNFSSIAGLSRKYLASITLSGGTVDALSINPDQPINSLYSNGSDVIAGGGFTFINAADRNHIAQVDLATYQLAAFNPALSFGAVYNIGGFLVNGTDLFVAGYFAYTDGGNSIGNILSLNTTTGNISHSFTQYPNGYLGPLAIYDNKLVVGGNVNIGTFNQVYDAIAGTSVNRNGIAAYNLSNYQLASVSYDPDSYPIGFYTDNTGGLVVAGGFSLMNAVQRNYLAAIDLNTMLPTPWDGQASSIVNTLALKDSTLYVGGNFGNIGGQTRSYLGAVSTNTGLARAFTFNTDNAVYALALSGDTVLYVGGAFTTVNGTSRNYGAAITTAGNGNLRSWAPNPNSYILTLAPVGTNVYIGGYFTTVKGSNRQYLAKVSNTASLNSWNPAPDVYPYTIIANNNGSTVYVGGSFSTIAGQTLYSLAAFNTATNALTAFDAKLKYNGGPTSVHSLALYGSKIFIGTDILDSVKGVSRGRLAAADTATGNATPFNPLPDATVNVLSVKNNRLVSGGDWINLGNNVSPSYAAFYTLEPLTQATSLSFTNLQPFSVTTNWTNGSGEGRIVIVKDASAPVAPKDGKGYIANAAIGSGDTIATGSYVVYVGTGSNVNVTNLQQHHTYYFAVYEYNGSGTSTEYLQTPSLSGSILTPCAPPQTPLAIKGAKTNLCGGGTNIRYSTDTIPNTASYTWTVPSSCSITSGQGTTAIKVTIPSNFVSGYVTVASVNACGTVSTRDSLRIIAKPSAPAKLTGPKNVTSGQAGLVYSVTAVTGVTFTWAVPSGAIITAGQGTNSITVTWGSVSGPVSVYAGNACGSSATKSLSVTVTGFALSFNDSKIGVTSEKKPTVFPNPAQSECTVVFEGEDEGGYILEITDVSGRSVLRRNGDALAGENKVNLDISRLANGIYFINIIDEEHGKRVLKLNKQ